MAEKEEKKVEDEGSKPPKDVDYGGGKKKIIVIVVIAIVIIAILAYVFLLSGDDGNGNGDNGDDNNPPSGDIVLTQEDFFVNKIIYFNSSVIDPDNDELTYKWDFDDGETSSKANATHTYDLSGTYNVTFTVTDEHGADDVDIEPIEVKDVPQIEMTVDRNQPFPSQPPVYTVTIVSIDSIAANLVHFYILDGSDESTLLEGNVDVYTAPPPHEYCTFYDFDNNGNLSATDYFTITDSGSLNPKGIDDGDIFRLTMEESDDQIGQVVLE